MSNNDIEGLNLQSQDIENQMKEAKQKQIIV